MASSTIHDVPLSNPYLGEESQRYHDTAEHEHAADGEEPPLVPQLEGGERDSELEEK